MRLSSILLVSALGLTACHAYQPPAAPSAPTDSAASTVPTRLVLTAGSRSDQQVDVTAQVLSADGHGVPNIALGFTIGAGTVTPSSGTTDSTGRVQAVAASTAQTTLTAVVNETIRASLTLLPSTPALSVTLFASTATVGSATTFSASVTGTPLGGPFVYAWTFGDGTTDQSSTGSTAHVYGAIGSYVASIHVTDGSGRAATASGSVSVTAVPPAPTPTPSPTTSGLVITLSCTPQNHGTATPCNVNATYNGTQLQASKITGVDWDWGDGFTDHTAVPVNSRNYVNAGSYIVFASATATTSDGSKTATASKSITVN